MAMNSYLRPTPVFFTAAGAALGFYFLASLNFIQVLLILFIMLILLMLIRSFVMFYFSVSKADLRFKLARRWKLINQCITVFAAGLVIGITMAEAGKSKINFALLPERVTAIEAVLSEDPRIISSGSAMAQVTLLRCAAMTPNGYMRATAQGEITVFFPEAGAEKLREFGRGTTVFLEGVLRSNENGGFTFSASSMHIIKPASGIERFRTDIRLSLIERTEGKEWGGLSLALLLGIRDNLDSELSGMYRKSGCSFILALSGMHLAVLAAIIAFLLKKPLGLKLSAVIGAVIIILYCLLVGPMPSLYRAALMYLLGVVAVIGFLPRQPLAILSLSFLIQIIATPSAGHSISFILSYLALLGIIAIGQPLYEIFAGKVPDFLMQPLSASCGAFLATAGVTGSVFGYVAPVGIAAGLILVPLTTLYMVLSILWLVLDNLLAVNLLAANLLALPLSFLYKLMEGIAQAAGNVPAINTPNSAIIIILSVIISILIIFFEYRQRKARLILKPL